MKNQIKYLQNLFYDLLNDYGRVFMVVKHSDRTSIGNRGFTDEEKEQGLILVFTSKNHKTIQWTEDGSILVSLGFGNTNKPENCFLHCNDIVAVYSPDAKVKLDRWDMLDIADFPDESEKPQKPKKEKSPGGNIVSLDKFRKVKT